MKEYRQIGKGKIDRDFREELEAYSFIEGPLSRGFTNGEFQQIHPTEASFASEALNVRKSFLT